MYLPTNMNHLHQLHIKCKEKVLLHSLDDHILCMGSCFADYLAKALRGIGFSNIFCDSSCCWHFTARTILEVLRHAEANKQYTEDDIYKADFLYNSPTHYRLSSPDPAVLLDAMNASTQMLREQVQKASLCVMTLGNATYITDEHTGCPITVTPPLRDENTKFSWNHSSVETVGAELQEIYDILSRLSANKICLILTVSPQRYNYQLQAWADRDDFFHEDKQVYNNFNKSILLCAVHEFVAKVSAGNSETQVEYFPSYEIVMDELRNENIHSRDGLHVRLPEVPNYVADRFLVCHASDKLQALFKARTPGFRWNFNRMYVANGKQKVDVSFFEQCLASNWHVAKNALNSLQDLFLFELDDECGKLLNECEPDVIAWARQQKDERIPTIPFPKEKLIEQNIHNIVIYGAGKHTRKLLRQGMPDGITVDAIVDDFEDGGSIFDIPVHGADCFELKPGQGVVVSSDAFEKDLILRAQERGWSPVFALYND